MLLNNVETDLKTRLEKEGITQKELAGQIGVSLPYVNRITRGREQLVNKTFLNINFPQTGTKPLMIFEGF